MHRSHSDQQGEVSRKRRAEEGHQQRRLRNRSEPKQTDKEALTLGGAWKAKQGTQKDLNGRKQQQQQHEAGQASNW